MHTHTHTHTQGRKLPRQLRTFREGLTKNNCCFSDKYEAVHPNEDDDNQLEYQIQYLKQRIGMRKSKDDTCSLADGVSAVVLTDESFANTHLTYKRTLMVRGDKTPPRYESVGERLCFADAYAVSNKGEGELSAKFVKGAFLKFRAQATGKKKTSHWPHSATIEGRVENA